MDSKLKQIDKEQADLEIIIAEMNKINAGASNEAISEIKKGKANIE